jgi:zinc transport system substrate-binding protein
MKGTISILATLLLFGCSDKSPDSSQENTLVFTSILPQSGLVRAISGENATVIPLVGEGQSPHSYEPTAQQLAKLANADALLTIGVPFETHLLKKIRPLYPELLIVENQTGINLRSMQHEHHGEHCTHDHGAKDPHIWLSPLNLATMSKTIYRTLSELDPENEAYFRKNHKTLAQELQRLHESIQKTLAPYKGASVYVFHPSFGYFTDTYGLKQVPIELDGKSPSPRQLADLIEQAQVDGVQIIFVSKQFPVGSAKAIADSIGGRVVQLDPLAEDVVANLEQIAESIALALKP